MYDLIVIGAGPAGATLARLAGGSRRVLLAEARAPHGAFGKRFPPEKCCGGLLAPDAQALLRRMGLVLPDAVLDSGQPLAVRALDLRSGQDRLYPRRYINLNRNAFEDWLLSLLPPQVTLLRGWRCTGLEPLPDGRGWNVRLKSAQGERLEQGRTLAAADGAGSFVRRALGAPVRPACRYLAVQDVFQPAGARPAAREYLAFFHPDITDFYGWAIPKQRRLLLGLALPLKTHMADQVRLAMSRARTLLEQRGHLFQGPAERQACQLLRPRPADIFLGRDNAWCLGEAAGWISPSSAEGFSYAFASALALAEALNAARGGRGEADVVLRGYAARTRLLRLNIAWKRAKSQIMFRPLARRLVMASGLLAE